MASQNGLLKYLGLEDFQPSPGYTALMAMLASGAENATRNVQGFIHDDPQVKAEWQKWNADTPLEDKVRQVGPFIPGIGEGVMMTNAAMDYADSPKYAGPGPGLGALLGVMGGAALGRRSLSKMPGKNGLSDYLMHYGVGPAVGGSLGTIGDVLAAGDQTDATVRKNPAPRMSTHKYGGQR